MNLYPDDTERDALAAQVRSVKPLDEARIEALLAATRAGDKRSLQKLVEQQFAAILEVAIVRETDALTVSDLFQEGGIAATVGVDEYATRCGPASDLKLYIRDLVTTHLDGIIDEELAHQREVKQTIADLEMLQSGEVGLRRELGRPPTTLELAARLDWTSDHVEVILAILRTARERYDEEIAQYVDYEDEDESDEA